jgi:hypothetical protein
MSNKCEVCKHGSCVCGLVTCMIDMTPSQKKELQSLNKLIEKLRTFAIADVEWYKHGNSYVYHPLFDKRNGVILASRAFMKELR